MRAGRSTASGAHVGQPGRAATAVSATVTPWGELDVLRRAARRARSGRTIERDGDFEANAPSERAPRAAVAPALRLRPERRVGADGRQALARATHSLGDQVKAGQTLAGDQAMKMENELWRRLERRRSSQRGQSAREPPLDKGAAASRGARACHEAPRRCATPLRPSRHQRRARRAGRLRAVAQARRHDLRAPAAGNKIRKLEYLLARRARARRHDRARHLRRRAVEPRAATASARASSGLPPLLLLRTNDPRRAARPMPATCCSTAWSAPRSVITPEQYRVGAELMTTPRESELGARRAAPT